MLWVLLAAALAGGCKSRQPASGANASGQDTSLPAAPPSPRGPGPMPYTASNAVVIEPADPDAALAQLSRELRRYVVRTRAVPRTFDEFIEKSHLQAPPPPAGKKYAIQGQAVVLVRR